MNLSHSRITLPVTKKGKRRSQTIIQAATNVFIQYGFNGASIDKILAISGGSRSSVYDIFGSKEGLFNAVIHDMVEQVFTTTPINLKDSSVNQILYEHAANYLYHVLKPDALNLYRMVISESDQFPGLARICYQAGPERFYKDLASNLEAITNLPQPTLLLASRTFLVMVAGDLMLQALSTPGFKLTRVLAKSHIDLSIQMCDAFFNNSQQPV